jgi:nicotinate-nucleotide pyrophosphorylase (carboxylating)
MTLPLSLDHLDQVVREALMEDVGAGDITTLATVPAEAHAEAQIVAKAAGVIAGLPVAQRVFHHLDPAVEFRPAAAEGNAVRPGETVARLFGRAHPILTGERVALNFLQHLSGIATRTSQFVLLVQGTRARIADTRKTVPGLRLLAKYAVRVGGGHNHRLGLYDAVLIKENHAAAAGGIAAAVARARAYAPHTMRIEVEVRDAREVEEALAAGADVILLDNFTLEQIRAAVEQIGTRALIEASGGITEENVAAIAATGVDVISVGALTHSVPALDLSLLLR